MCVCSQTEIITNFAFYLQTPKMKDSMKHWPILDRLRREVGTGWERKIVHGKTICCSCPAYLSPAGQEQLCRQAVELSIDYVSRLDIRIMIYEHKLDEARREKEQEKKNLKRKREAEEQEKGKKMKKGWGWKIGSRYKKKKKIKNKKKYPPKNYKKMKNKEDGGRSCSFNQPVSLHLQKWLFWKFNMSPLIRPSSWPPGNWLVIFN